VTVFLMGDGVTGAIAGRKTPDGYYKLDRTLGSLTRRGAAVLCCGTCIDARASPSRVRAQAARRRPWWCR
jgi:uncharacterized protein involved in oxidation of intracellular sulfur